MTYNEKELILLWLSKIEKLSKKKGYGNTPKQEYFERLTGILTVTQQAKNYISSVTPTFTNPPSPKKKASHKQALVAKTSAPVPKA